MSRTRTITLFLAGLLVLMTLACQSMGNRDTIAKLREEKVEIEEIKIEGGLDKAMESYKRFLEETPDSPLAPDAIRRLADLKIEKEYGTLTDPGAASTSTKAAPTAAKLTTPAPAAVAKPVAIGAAGPAPQPPTLSAQQESDAQFERRAARQQPIPTADRETLPPVEGADDLERAGALEAITLYQQLLEKFPHYERNDQVLYQMSRAYEELGRIEEAMQVMDRLVRQYPDSRYIDEVQFRRAEYFFARKKYLDAEEAYSTIVKMGVGSTYYELALYKLGWTFYKQEMYEDGLHRFIALLDYKTSVGYDFSQTEDETEHKRSEDTFRVISLSYSNLGGADSVVDYFSRYGKRPYEDLVYGHLGEFYFDKRRYADAAATYNAFVERNPFHKVAPNYHMRVIEIHTAGGFPSLVLEAKKAFATNYGLKAPYWNYFEPADRPDVLGLLKTNLTDLASHYHAGYQDRRKEKEKEANFKEALHWYREFLASFPADEASPITNYHLADLLRENKDFSLAAAEYEHTAYGYGDHDKADAAGYAAVYAHREHLAAAPEAQKDAVKREVVRSSLKFADTFPKHEKAAIVLGAAADDLYVMKEYEQALAAATKLIETFPDSEVTVRRAAWLVKGHASYELASYAPAEAAYVKVLELLPKEDESRKEVVDNLAAAIYKQGEAANGAKDYQAAADHFLRVGLMAPGSKIRANAEFDGAGALIQLKQWERAASVLTGFRKLFPEHPLLPEVTKKVAYVYKEDGKLSLAAAEYERIETESKDEQIRQEALQLAAELYVQDNDKVRALVVYRRYVDYFAAPVEVNLETRNKIADILKEQGDRNAYLVELRTIVSIDDSAAKEDRTDRTRFLAAKASLVLAEEQYAQFTAIQLVQPFKKNLAKKRDSMKLTTQAFNKLAGYEIGETTAAATFYLAEIYAHFSKALLNSERPQGLDDLEAEQYEMAIEEQAYPFEDRSIKVHQDNMKLIQLGVYNEWIDKSLQRLATLMPARYDKPETHSDIVASMESFTFAVAKPLPPAAPPADGKMAEKKTATEGVEPSPAQKEQAASEQDKADASPPPAQDTVRQVMDEDAAAQSKAAAEPAAPEGDTESESPKANEASVPPAASVTAGKIESPSPAVGKQKDQGDAAK